MEQIKKDLKTLGIDEDKLDTLTVKDARTGYHETARKIHPDKADQNNHEQVQKQNAAFQEAGNAYGRILKYIIARLQDQKNRDLEPVNDEDTFARDNFDKFNFPSENIGSFTVLVEDHLAELWQDSLQEIYGEPRIVKVATTGTESDRIWKITYINNMEITLHFYNHNKPKDKKQSKVLVQGGNQLLLCEFVFGELPKIYKMVVLKQKNTIPVLRESKRKRIATPVKKRNIKHKAILEELKCALCEFASTTKVKIIRHMKSTHTEQGKTVVVQKETPPVDIEANKPLMKQMVEDMSICEIVEDEKQLIENKKFEECEFRADTEKSLEIHVKDEHEQELESLHSIVKCDECTFITKSGVKLQEHKVKHVNETKRDNSEEIPFMHSCVTCDFNTNDYQILKEHVDSIHRKKVKTVDEPLNEISSVGVDMKAQNIDKHTETKKEEEDRTEQCKPCGESFSNVLDLEWHNETQHKESYPDGSIQKTKIQCDQCELSFAEVPNFITHIQSYHSGNQELIPCKSCNFKTLNKQSLYDHIEHEHIEYAMLASITDGQANMHTNFEGFKGELCDVLNKIIESQNKIIENQNKIFDDNNTIKQELFILKNQTKNLCGDIMQEEVVSKTMNSQKLQESSKTKPAIFVPPPVNEKQVKTPHIEAARVPPPRSTRYPKVCIIGDSISGGLDNKMIAKTMNAEVRAVRAYSTLQDTKENVAREETKFPEKSFQRVIEKEVENSETDILIVQSTSIDITNFKTSNENVMKYSEYFKQETIIAASNLVTAVENTLKSNPRIKKAIIMKQIPRYDHIANDPQGIKSTLRQLYNDSIEKQLTNSPLKDKMILGNHELECTGAVREARYRSGMKYDGIHMSGPSGRKAYMESVLMILRSAGLIKISPPSYFRRYHNISTTSQDRYHCPTQDTDYLNDRDIRVKNLQSRYQYSIPTANRFSHLSQGNY